MKKETNNHLYQCPLCGAVSGLSFNVTHDAEADCDITRWEFIKTAYHLVSFHYNVCKTSIDIRTLNSTGLISLFTRDDKKQDGIK